MAEVFAGRYELIEPIAVGGMGTVWCIRDLQDGEIKAAKILQQSDAALLLRFMREQTMRFDHSHVVTPQSWAGMDDKVLFTMPLLRGGSVSELAKQHGGKLPPRWVALFVEQTLMALEAVHGAGIVHRDIKPANLLLEPTGTGRPHLRVTDFGIAVPLDEPRMTRASVVIGTPGYMAPEQLRGGDPDPRSDIFSTGQVGLELLTGVRPGVDPIDPDTHRSDQPGRNALLDLLQRAGHPDPAERFQSAAELRQELAALHLAALPPEPGEHIDISDQYGDLDHAPTQSAAFHEAPTRVSTSGQASTRVGSPFTQQRADQTRRETRAGGARRAAATQSSSGGAITALVALVGLLCLVAAFLLW